MVLKMMKVVAEFSLAESTYDFICQYVRKDNCSCF